MPKKRKLVDLSECCRFCLTRNDCSKELFADWIKPKIDDLEKCANLKITDKPKYPKRICYVCLYKLQMWSDLKSQFLETNQILNARIKILDSEPIDIENTYKNKNAVCEVPEDNAKRPRIAISETTTDSNWTHQDPLDTSLQSNRHTFPNPISDSLQAAPKKIIDSIIEDFATDSTTYTEPFQIQAAGLSDTTSVSRKSGRLKKTEQREALTKRWVERKNALMAAQGEVPSESESDNGSQLSPVQKARAKANKELELDTSERQRKMNRALKNLEMNLSEKFQFIDVDSKHLEENKMKLRRNNEEELKLEKNFNSKKTLQDTQMNSRRKKSPVINSKEKNIKATPSGINILSNKKNIVNEKQFEENNKSSKDQCVRTEVTFGKATYVISASLNHPESAVENVLSKNNGINVDVTSQDGRNLDIMKAVELRRVMPKKSTDTSRDKNNENKEFSEKCFQIKVEGMEPEDLQRVQIELVKFINQDKDIGKLLQCSTTSGENINQSDPTRAYKRLNQKLKEIVKNVLQQNTDQEKLLQEIAENKRKILPEYFEAIKNSFLFQPTVNLTRLDRKLFKQYKINNLKLLEELKRLRGLVGPLSRALGKRKPVMPKKYEDFSLSTKPDPSEYLRVSSKPAPKQVNIHKISNEFCLDPWDSDNSPVQIISQSVATAPQKTSSQTPEPKVTQSFTLEPKNISETTTTSKSVFPMTAVPKNVLMPTLVPKTTVPISNVSSSIPVISKVKKSSSGTKNPFKITTPISVKSQTKSTTATSKNKSANLKNQTQSRISTSPAKSKTIKTVTLPQTTPKTTSISALNPSDVINDAKKFESETSRTILKIKETPITITDDDDYDVIIQACDATDAIVIMDSSPSPATKLKEPTKSVTSKEKSSAAVASNTAVERNSKSSAIKNVDPTGSNIVLTAPPESNVTTVTNSKIFTDKKQSALAEFLQTPGKKKASKESSEISKVSNSVANSEIKDLIKSSPNSSPVKSKNASKTTIECPVQLQRHICGICGEELHSKEEAEAHVKNHKIDTSLSANKSTKINNALINSSQKSSITPRAPKGPKPKLMKCKRCQAIVEAVNVRTHVCNSIKYNCTLCDCSFGADHLLVQHMETHVQPKIKENNKIKNKKGNRLSRKDENAKTSEQEEEGGEDDEAEDLENILADKTEGYSCFVCDKIFIDEEQMKDHLQMHCEEVSEEINDKGGFQCAFCAEKFQSEESLETHVGNHLMENGDEKISMMINLETRKHKKSLFQCEQCAECFTSSLNLAMHLPIHEEEDDETVMMTDFAKEGEEIIEDEEEEETAVEQHVCQICDEIFDSVDDLVVHNDSHNGQNAHVCILCEKTFSSLQELQAHVPSHL